MLEFNFKASEEDSGLRVDEFLARRLGCLSRMRISRLIASGCCKVSGRLVESGQKIKPGDSIEFKVEYLGPNSMTPEPIPLEILYEDEHICVLVKPTGLLVHPTKHIKSGTLANALVYHFNRSRHGELIRPGIAHRLDRDTSGLMVVAKTGRALSILSRHFRRRLVEKRYMALVFGRVSEDEGVISAPIGRALGGEPRWRALEGGKAAQTRFRVLERIDLRASLLELEPITGRTNQLRIHCAHMGHPIFGDDKYGGPAGPGRLFLHASRLVFYHPAGGRTRMEFSSPLPAELRSFLEQLKESI
jgi:23S rRNA pseudouridine1911/1915/1917 synthase